MEIIPGKSVGSFEIGMSLEACEAFLGPAIDKFRRTPGTTDLVVAYDSQHMHLNVNSDGKVVSITFFRPAKIELGGVQLLDRNLASVENDLSKAGYRCTSIDAGLWCEEAGVLLIEVSDCTDGVEILGLQNHA